MNIHNIAPVKMIFHPYFYGIIIGSIIFSFFIIAILESFTEKEKMNLFFFIMNSFILTTLIMTIGFITLHIISRSYMPRDLLLKIILGMNIISLTLFLVNQIIKKVNKRNGKM